MLFRVEEQGPSAWTLIGMYEAFHMRIVLEADINLGLENFYG